MNHALFLRPPQILSHPAQTPEVPHSKDPPLSQMKNYFLLVAARRRGAIGSERDVTRRRTKLQSLGKSARLSPVLSRAYAPFHYGANQRKAMGCWCVPEIGNRKPLPLLAPGQCQI